MNLNYVIILLGLLIVVNGYNLRGGRQLRRGRRRGRNRRGRNRGKWRNGGSRVSLFETEGGKYNAPQKRQTQRDQNRFNPNHPSFNPNRNQWEEDHERERKHIQAQVSGRPRRDPYEPNYGNKYYARKREVARQNRFDATGRDGGYHALSWNGNDQAFDIDRIHNRDYGNSDYGVGNAWWPN
eukprot:356850_1